MSATVPPFDLARFPIAAAGLELDGFLREVFAQRMASLRDRATPMVAQRFAGHLIAQRDGRGA